MNETPLQIIRRLRRIEFKTFADAQKAGDQLGALLKTLDGQEKAECYAALDHVANALRELKPTTVESAPA